MSILSIKNLGKSYKKYKSEAYRIASWLGFDNGVCEEHWILQNISFEVMQGESIGIVGKNGAGKSTLLKMITGTLKPSTGSVSISGRVSAILELGMGFNPELTGRQNVQHVLGLMGCNHQEITSLIPQIEDFCEIGEYFDQPVRIYSSGMQMRVAFGVATAYRPDLLIIDEALSVGDAYFQHKSFSRISEMQKKGTSLILVSHDLNSIKMVCNKALFLHNGGIIMEGSPENVLDVYNAKLANNKNQRLEQIPSDTGKRKTISGTGEATIENIELLNEKNEPTQTLCVGEQATLKVKVRIHENIEQLVLGYAIRNHLGQTLFGTNTFHTKQILTNIKKDHEIYYCISFPTNLGVGNYSIQLALVDSDTHLNKNYEWIDLAYVFEVININKAYFVGYNFMETKIRIEY